MRSISREELSRRLARERPQNEDRIRGFALVCVLNAEGFQRAHIPESINIPYGQEDECERRFDKGKEIIVYCASPDCPASSKSARELEHRGFTNISRYEGGTSDWQIGGNWLERGKGAGQEEKKVGNY